MKFFILLLGASTLWASSIKADFADAVISDPFGVFGEGGQ